MTKPVPTLYEWAGGAPALLRLTEVFYDRVRADPLLAPVFAQMPHDHPQHVATWLGEVFGGPPLYTEQHGGYPHMLAKHRNRALTEEQRLRWVQLDLRGGRRGRPPGRSRVPLRVRRLHRVGHAAGGVELAAGRRAAAGGAGPALGLGRGAALHRLSVA